MGFDVFPRDPKKELKLECTKNDDCSLAFLKPRLGAAALASASSGGRSRLMVFVHGGHGDYFDTWFNSDANVYWPKLVRYDTANFGLMDVATFDYFSPFINQAMGVEQIAINLRDMLKERNAVDYDDIVFVAHSLGGVVTRQLLVDLAKSNDPLYGKIRLVASMACAYGGALVPLIAYKLFSRNLQFKDVGAGSDFLEKLNTAWVILQKKENPQQRQRPFVWSVRGEKDQAVLERDAVNGCDTVVRMITTTGSIIVTDEHWDLGSDAFLVNDKIPSFDDVNSEMLFPKTISQARPGGDDLVNHTELVKPDSANHSTHLALREAFHLAMIDH